MQPQHRKQGHQPFKGMFVGRQEPTMMWNANVVHLEDYKVYLNTFQSESWIPESSLNLMILLAAMN